MIEATIMCLKNRIYSAGHIQITLRVYGFLLILKDDSNKLKNARGKQLQWSLRTEKHATLITFDPTENI